MNLDRFRRLAAPATIGIALVFLYGCGESPPDQMVENTDPQLATTEMPANAESEDVTAIRRLTAGYGDIAVAQAAGYTEQITPCWYHRDRGGQGYHFGRPDLIDGTVSLLEPELVMYEPTADGRQQFVGIEYIVPFAEWTQAAPPNLLGRNFMRNEQLELYVLHVWLGKDNPAGLYADWNPTVSCQHAAESEDRA